VLDVTTGGFRIRSFPRERAQLVGIVVVRSSASSVTISHLVIQGDGSANTVKIYAPDITIEDNTITNDGRGWSCLVLGSTDDWGKAARPIVRRNRFHDCGSLAHDNKDHAIYAASIIQGKIVGNLFWNTAAYAIHLYPDAQRALVAHNVIDGASPSNRGGIVFGGSGSYASNDNVVAYNVIIGATYNITSSWEGTIGIGNVARNNCLWAGRDGDIADPIGFTAAQNVIAIPRFLNRAKRDYRLAPTSPCRRVVGYDAAARLRSD
jgi:Right handed beta helix region